MAVFPLCFQLRQVGSWAHEADARYYCDPVTHRDNLNALSGTMI
jgi:hypothetical protein